MSWIKTFFNFFWLFDPSVSVLFGVLAAFVASLCVLFFVRNIPPFTKVKSTRTTSALIGIVAGVLLAIFVFMKGGDAGQDELAPVEAGSVNNVIHYIEIVFDFAGQSVRYEERYPDEKPDRSTEIAVNPSEPLTKIRHELEESKKAAAPGTLFLVTVVDCEDFSLLERIRKMILEVLSDQLYGGNIDIISNGESPKNQD